MTNQRHPPEYFVTPPSLVYTSIPCTLPPVNQQAVACPNSFHEGKLLEVVEELDSFRHYEILKHRNIHYRALTMNKYSNKFHRLHNKCIPEQFDDYQISCKAAQKYSLVASTAAGDLPIGTARGRRLILTQLNLFCFICKQPFGRGGEVGSIAVRRSNHIIILVGERILTEIQFSILGSSDDDPRCPGSGRHERRDDNSG